MAKETLPEPSRPQASDEAGEMLGVIPKPRLWQRFHNRTARRLSAKSYYAQEKVWAKDRQGTRTDLDTSVPAGTKVEKSDNLSTRAASRAAKKAGTIFIP